MSLSDPIRVSSSKSQVRRGGADPSAGRAPWFWRLGSAWSRIRGWRRIRFTRAGMAFTLGVLAVGFAAINTGNNLLHLLLGAMLGLIVVSGWLSERSVRGLEVVRRTPGGTFVGREVRLHYRIQNTKSRRDSLAVEVEEVGLPGRTLLHRIPAGGSRDVKASKVFVRRGVHPLSTITLSTTWPFGLFRKERDLHQPGELVIWPRTDRPVGPPSPLGTGRPRGMLQAAGPAGPRGEYRNLREYRAGDDVRDIHWRRSAGLERPVVREYERDSGEAFWICLDTGAPPGPAAEEGVEIAASLAARASADGRRFGLVAGPRRVGAGTGPAHLEVVLDALARTDFAPADPPPSPPSPRRSVLVTTTGRGRAAFADTWMAGRDSAGAGRNSAGARRDAAVAGRDVAMAGRDVAMTGGDAAGARRDAPRAGEDT